MWNCTIENLFIIGQLDQQDICTASTDDLSRCQDVRNYVIGTADKTVSVQVISKISVIWSKYQDYQEQGDRVN